MKFTPTERVMDAIQGATIASAGVDIDEHGIHIWFQDGRVLVITGALALSLVRMEQERLH